MSQLFSRVLSRFEDFVAILEDAEDELHYYARRFGHAFQQHDTKTYMIDWLAREYVKLVGIIGPIDSLDISFISRTPSPSGQEYSWTPSPETSPSPSGHMVGQTRSPSPETGGNSSSPFSHVSMT